MFVYNLPLEFQRIAAAHGGRAALRFEGAEPITYAELNARANRVARYLQQLGVGAGDVVCISGDKRPATFACMIACLKLGAPYCILDPDSPPRRLERIVRSCLPRALVVGESIAGALGRIPVADDARVVHHGEQALARRCAGLPDGDLPESAAVTGTAPAYVMYTSGTTGTPKGAVMTHANVLNLIRWSTGEFETVPDDVFTNVNPLYFDNSVFDFYSALFSGASLAPLSSRDVRRPSVLLGAVERLGCTSWFSVPSLLLYLDALGALDATCFPTLRRIIFGGEGYPTAKLKQLFDLVGDRIELVNVYGPTECTCICSSHRIGPADLDDLAGFPPLGRLIPNFSFMILDEDLGRAPPGDVGELCLLGPHLGRGYYRDPEQTRTRFVQNPFNTSYPELIYRTGDLVRLDPARGLEILGRMDNQIKHMGYRIELEEIDTALSRLDYVAEALAVHSTSDGVSTLAAAVKLKGPADEGTVRRDLRDMLPRYMIPTRIRFLDGLPRNANGKTDRRVVSELVFAGGAADRDAQSLGM